jgi:integrase
MEELLGRSRASTTVASYARWEGEFEAFLRRRPGMVGLAVPRQLALFATELLDARRGGVARVAVCAVAFREVRAGRPSPLEDRQLKLVLDAVDREWGAQAVRRTRDPFPVEALRRWVEQHDGAWTWIAARDAAIVALGLRAMRRAGELGALEWADVVDVSDREIKVCVRKSKTDQTGKGHDIYIEATGEPTCPIRLLRGYKAMCADTTGRVFRSTTGGPLSSSAVSSVCRRVVAAAGLTAAVSSHSLRIGGATAAMEGGLSKEQIMAIGGWKSNSVERYLRARETAALGTSQRMGL